MPEPDPDRVEAHRYGETTGTGPCEKCPAIAQLQLSMRREKVLAFLVLDMTTETTPAGMVSDMEKRARQLATEILGL